MQPSTGTFVVPAALAPNAAPALSPYVVAGDQPTAFSSSTTPASTPSVLDAAAPSVETPVQRLVVDGLFAGTTPVVPSPTWTASDVVGLFAASQAVANAPAPTISLTSSTSSNDVVSGDTSTGPTASGFDEANPAVATGFDAFVATLVRAGYSSLQMATVLTTNFGESQTATVGELIYLNYDVDGIAEVLATTFNESAVQVGVDLKALQYQPGQIAAALQAAFP
jgi:hypothetical protein